MDRSSGSELLIFWIITIVWCSVSLLASLLIGSDIITDIGTADWTPIEGNIIDSGVDESSDSEGGVVYCLWVEYEYTIENSTYDGSIISYSTQNSCDSWSGSDASKYPPNKKITVYVNPEDVSEAVLLPGLAGINFFMIFFLVFPLIGFVMLIGVLKATLSSIRNPGKTIVETSVTDSDEVYNPSEENSVWWESNENS